MTLKLNGTNSVAAPAYAGDDADTGLQCGTNELKLVTNGSARATVDSSGSLGVGTESPDNRLHVASGSSTQVKWQATNSGSVYTRFQNTNNARGYIGYEAKKLVFYADNGSDSSNKKIAAMDADGLKFNEDTAAANALSDYEEGTWTPTLTGSSSAPTLTYNTRLGEYVKIGSVVYLSFFIQVANVTAQGAGQLRMTGLPFSAKNSTGAGEVPGLLLQSEPFTSGDGSNRFQMVRTAPSQAQFYLLYKDLTTGQTHIDNNSATSIGTGYMIGNITYQSA